MLTFSPKLWALNCRLSPETHTHGSKHGPHTFKVQMSAGVAGSGSWAKHAQAVSSKFAGGQAWPPDPAGCSARRGGYGL